jgi:2-C-methyl-D-erythritol 4-phosphate cytidylyltransferase
MAITQNISAILLAGGSGTRMRAQAGSTPKQFLEIQGKPLALYSFEILCAYPFLEIIVVCDPKHYSLFQTSPHISLKRANPGNRRQDSVFNALQCVKEAAQLVCIHDCARPLLTYADLEQVIAAADKTGAAVLGSPVKNTIKECNERTHVTRTLDRTHLWEIYTPQVAHISLLKQGYALADLGKHSVTDDMSLIELTGHPVELVAGSSLNIKVTYPEDLALANALITQLSHSHA